MTTSASNTVIPEDGVPVRALCCLLTIIAITSGFVFGRSPVPSINFSLTDGSLLIVSIWLCIAGNMVSYHYRSDFPKALKTALNIGAIAIALNLARELWVGNVNSEQFEFTYPLVNMLIATSVISSFEIRTRNDILVNATFGLSLMALAGCSGRSILFGAAVLFYIVVGALLLLLVARSSSTAINVADRRLVSSQCRGRHRPALLGAVFLLPTLSLALFSFLPRIDLLMDNLVTNIRSLTTGLIYTVHMQRLNQGERFLGPTMLPEASPNVKAHSLDEFKKHNWDARPLDSAKEKPSPPPPKESEPPPGRKPDKRGQPAADLMRTKLDSAKPFSMPAPGAAIATGRTPGRAAPLVNSQASRGAPTAPHGLSKPDNAKAEARHSGRSNAGKSAQSRGISPAANNKNARKTAKANGSAANHQLAIQHNAQPPDTSLSGKRNLQGNKAQSNSTKPASGGREDRNSKQTKSAAAKRSTAPNSSKDATSRTLALRTPLKEALVDSSEVDLRAAMSRSDQVLLTMSCNRSLFVKVMAYDTFDGLRWTRHDPAITMLFMPTIKGVDVTSAPPLQVSDALPVMQLAEDVTVKSATLKAVPVGGIAKQLSLIQPVTVDINGNVLASKPLGPGDEYTAICDWPVFSLPEMRKAKSLADRNDLVLEPYLKLPKNQSRELIALSRQLTVSGANRFLQAESIVSYLRKNCRYSDQPVTGNDDENLADKFVFDTKSGDCKSFATTFCMLCRAAGIPARYVSGFLPGDADPLTGATLIRRRHGHAWAEIYMEPYGWIPFDPTPGGLLPARPEQQYYNYQEVSRRAKQYATTTGRSLASAGADALGYISQLLKAVPIIAAVLAVGASFVALLIWIKRAIESRRHFHPAKPLRRRVLKQLRRFGIEENRADTGADLIHRFEAALSAQTVNPNIDQEVLKQSVTEFFTTYNAVVFGREDEMESLKATTLSIEYQLRRN